MRISDWSSDVCSSDLRHEARQRRQPVVLDRLLGGQQHGAGAVAHLRGVAGGNGAAELSVAEHRAQLRQTLGRGVRARALVVRSEEHTSELQSLMRSSYAVFCLKKKRHPLQQVLKNSNKA